MKVVFADCEIGIGVALYVAGSEFLKGAKSTDEFCSLAAATDAFYNQQGYEYHINHDDYDTVRQWIKATDSVIFIIEQDRYGHRRWHEIHACIANRYVPIIFSDDGREYFTKDPSELKSVSTRQKGGHKK